MINGGLLRRIVIWIGVGSVLIAIAPLLLSAFVHWQGGRLAGPLVDDVRRSVGLNPWQAMFLSVLMGAIGAFAVRLMMSWQELRIASGMAILATMTASTYAYLWHQTRDDWFGSSGEPLKCYVLTGNRLRVMNRIDHDRTTGAKCAAVDSPELAERLQAWLVRHADGAVFLSPISRPSAYFSPGGSAIVWYFRHSGGRIDLFDLPGVHPITGVELLPVTRDVTEEAERAFDQAERRVAVAKAPRALSNETRPDTAPSAPQLAMAPLPKPPTSPRVEPVSAQLDRYLNTATVQRHSDVIAFVGDDEIARSIIEQLPQPLSISPFRPSFFSDGLFDRGLLGDADSLRRAGLGDYVKRVYLLRVSSPRSQRSSDLEGITRTDVTIEFVEIDVAAATVVRRKNGGLIGRGFSPDAAIRDLRTSAAPEFARAALR